ncbi:hypothetical protein [Clostridium oceanicum]|uniref:Transcription factor zinc-finger domain-containing protein n=1 Tax=Clostridium oceanicum TaxID=1543 RepID=A0ABP3UVV5_9CLOT
MVYCPFCENQGVIYEAKIKYTNKYIYICDECDTVWIDKNINEDNCKSFDDIMSEIGRNSLWSELSELERI